MKYDSDTFCDQYPLAIYFVQHLAYYRASKAAFDDLGMKSAYWAATLSSYLMLAAIHWCKVFGSHGCNATHWKHVATADVDNLQDQFRARVLTVTGLSKTEWERYHRQMCDFRNKFIAHRDRKYKAPVPDFDVALGVVYAYDDWIRELIRPDYYDGPTLREKFDHWRTTSGPIAEQAMKATNGMKE